MKILNLLNPRKWGGQILLLVLFGTTVYGLGYVHGIKSVEIPATTTIKIGKVKKGSNVTTNLTNMDNADCNEYFNKRLKTLSMKEIKSIRK